MERLPDCDGRAAGRGVAAQCSPRSVASQNPQLALRRGQPLAPVLRHEHHLLQAQVATAVEVVDAQRMQHGLLHLPTLWALERGGERQESER